MNDFEMLLCEHRNPVERFVKYRISSDFDADDILQEIYLAAYTHFDMLADKSNFKAWILGIARHKCNDYYRKKAQKAEISIDESENPAFSYGRMGLITSNPVRDILSTLSKNDREILYLYYFNELPQSEIAKKLKIPVGTVKSRLHTAKINFKKQYPHRQKSKGDILMKNLPEYIPDYKIEKTDKEPFSVVWEELMGWFIVPKLGEKLAFGIYEQPEGKRTELCEMEVVGKAIIHGIEGFFCSLSDPSLLIHNLLL